MTYYLLMDELIKFGKDGDKMQSPIPSIPKLSPRNGVDFNTPREFDQMWSGIFWGAREGRQQMETIDGAYPR